MANFFKKLGNEFPILNNITGSGKGGFFNNFAGGLFGGNYWEHFGKGFAGNNDESTMGNNYLGGLASGVLNLQNKNQIPSMETTAGAVGGGSGGNYGSAVGSILKSLQSNGTNSTQTNSYSPQGNNFDFSSILKMLPNFGSQTQQQTQQPAGQRSMNRAQLIQAIQQMQAMRQPNVEGRNPLVYI